MTKEKIVLVVAVLLVFFAGWQLKTAVSDPVEVPEIPPVEAGPPPDMELGGGGALFEDGELAKLLGLLGTDARNPWVRYEGLMKPNASLIPLPPPPSPPPEFVIPSLSNAVYTDKKNPKGISQSQLAAIKVIDRPKEEEEEQDEDTKGNDE